MLSYIKAYLVYGICGYVKNTESKLEPYDSISKSMSPTYVTNYIQLKRSEDAVYTEISILFDILKKAFNGEVWKIENSIHDLVQKCTEVLSDNPLFFLINSYTTGLQPTVMENILRLSIGNKGKFDSYEVGLKTDEGIVLPCGCSALWTK